MGKSLWGWVCWFGFLLILDLMVPFVFLKDTPDAEDFESVLELMVEYGTLEATIEIAATYRDLALEALVLTPSGPCRDSLQVLANYVLERSL